MGVARAKSLPHSLPVAKLPPMIAQLETPKVAVDLGRPSFFEDRHFQYWADIFDFIETSDVKIAVNGMYHRMRELCDAKKGYGGNGFSFMFWFESFEDCKAFEDGMNIVRKKYDLDPMNPLHRKIV